MALDVVVLGGGVAGLAAAARLAESGLRVDLVEARRHLGGRVETIRGPRWPVPIEAGAEFVHGREPMMWSYLQRKGIVPYDSNQEHWTLQGRRLRPRDDIWDEIETVFERLPRKGPDMPFREFLARRFPRLPPRKRERLLLFVQGLNAADADRISVRALAAAAAKEDEIEASTLHRLVDGYGALVEALAADCRRNGVRIRLGTAVRRITWAKGRVQCEAAAGVRLRARRAVITLPLGVLQAPTGSRGAVVFEPPLPEKIDAASRLEFGPVVKVALRFRDAFWEHDTFRTSRRRDALRNATFFHASKAPIPTWWTYLPLRAPVLVGWAGGPKAERIGRRPKAAILRDALASLSKIFGRSPSSLRRLLVAHEVFDWQADAYARGAYSYVPVGGLDAARKLARPVLGTLFWAGEATAGPGLAATVPGAFATGRRAAREVLRSAGRTRSGRS